MNKISNLKYLSFTLLAIFSASSYAALTNMSTWTLAKGRALVIGERHFESKEAQEQAKMLLSALKEGSYVPTTVLVESSLEKYAWSNEVLARSAALRSLVNAEGRMQGSLDVVEDLAHQSKFTWRQLNFVPVDKREVIVHSLIDVIEGKLIQKTPIADAKRYWNILHDKKCPSVKVYLASLKKLIDETTALIEAREPSKVKTYLQDVIKSTSMNYENILSFANKKQLLGSSLIDLVYAKKSPIDDMQFSAIDVMDPFMMMEMESRLLKGENVVFMGGRMHAIALSKFLHFIGAENHLNFGNFELSVNMVSLTNEELSHGLQFFRPFADARSFALDPVCDTCKKQAELKQCSACFAAHYCSSDCQKKDWPSHKPFCKTLAFCKK